MTTKSPQTIDILWKIYAVEVGVIIMYINTFDSYESLTQEHSTVVQSLLDCLLFVKLLSVFEINNFLPFTYLLPLCYKVIDILVLCLLSRLSFNISSIKILMFWIIVFHISSHTLYHSIHPSQSDCCPYIIAHITSGLQFL